MDISTIIFWAVLIGTGIFVVAIYNKLVALKNNYQNGFAQIEVELKRRYDLIPNLLETAKAYMAHESETLEAVVAARNGAQSALNAAAQDPSGASIDQLSKAEGQLQGALGRMNIVMEDYPDLKANQNMMQLSEELSTTENRIAIARQAFNNTVTEYNSYRQSFPPVIFASKFGHPEDASLLEFEDSEAIQEAPKVSF